MPEQPTFFAALVAGAAAGTAVDIVLFPLDTMKTRLQSRAGFWKAGGVRGVYSGLASAALGSAPTAAAFFVTYEGTKKLGVKLGLMDTSVTSAAVAASFGEVVGCIVRVPVEVVKQRVQASQHRNSMESLRKTLAHEGYKGLYRGYFSTVLREIPFSLVQFPIWEVLKRNWTKKQGRYVECWQSAVCGAVAGAVAGAVTTPLDVVKTRIMLAQKDTPLASGKVLSVLRVVWIENGIQGLFAGVVPRVLWISTGGAIFLGVYEKVKSLLGSFGVA